MKFCPYCGASLAGSAVSFCSECGKSVNSPAEDGCPLPEKPAKNPQPVPIPSVPPQRPHTGTPAANSKNSTQRTPPKQPQAAPRPPQTQNKRPPVKKRKKPASPVRPKPDRRKQQTPQSKPARDPMDENYDGYYDDVPTIDDGQTKEKLEPELIKRIVLVAVGAIVMIILSVVIMYVL